MTKEKTVGFRIYLNTPRPDSSVSHTLRNVPTGNVCDAMDRLMAMDYRIKPLDSKSHLCGPALTVRTKPGDNLMVWKAIDIAKPGDVLVIATYQHTTLSTFGDLVVRAAQAKGLAGIVCDGMCRDASGIRTIGLPTFVTGTVPSSPGKDGHGEIGGPVSCGGLPVHSGDIIVGDEDGVVVIPLADVGEVLERLKKVLLNEQTMLADIEAGQLLSPKIDRLLEEKGVEYIG